MPISARNAAAEAGAGGRRTQEFVQHVGVSGSARTAFPTNAEVPAGVGVEG